MMRNRTVARSTIVGVVILIALTVAVKHAWGTEAPGCGNQHYRPRLAQCCPKFLANEDLPPKCTHALADGFLAQCCTTEPTPQVTSTPVATCPGPEWDKCWPTPEATYTPTTVVNDKRSCCANVLAIYQTAMHLAFKDYKELKRDLKDWKVKEMQRCREDYAR